MNELVKLFVGDEDYRPGHHFNEWYFLLSGLSQGHYDSLVIKSPRHHGRTITMLCYALHRLAHHDFTRNVSYVTFSQARADNVADVVLAKKHAYLDVVLYALSKSPDDAIGYYSLSSETPQKSDLVIFDDVETPWHTVDLELFDEWWYAGKNRILIGTPWDVDNSVFDHVLNSTPKRHAVSWQSPAIVGGKALWPEGYSLERMERVKRHVSPMYFNTMYQIGTFSDAE